MAGAQCQEPYMRKRCLTDLPENILFDIFDHLDDVSLCEVAQLCPTFWRLGGNSKFWMHMDTGVMPEDRLKMAIVSCLSSTLRLPPQIFAQEAHIPSCGVYMRLHSGIFGKTPLEMSLYSLQFSVGYWMSADEVAAACSRITEQIKRAQQASQDEPAALFESVERDEICVRFKLHQRRVTTAILDGLEQLGWPTALSDSDFARSQRPTSRSSARWRLLWHEHHNVLNPEQTSKRVKNSKRHTFKYYAPSYWSLSKGALQCLKAAHLKGKHLSLLQNLLGPAEALAQHGTKHDMALLMELQGILFHYMELLTAAETPDDNVGTVGTMAHSAADALEGHLSTLGLPTDTPNSLSELAECIRKKQSCTSSARGQPPEGVREGEGLAASETEAHADRQPEDQIQAGGEGNAVTQSKQGDSAEQIAGVLQSIDVRLRLKARLHLEVLRVMHWGFFVMVEDLELYPD